MGKGIISKTPFIAQYMSYEYEKKRNQALGLSDVIGLS